MSSPRLLILWAVIIAGSPGFSVEPAPKALSEPLSAVPASPVKVPSADPEQVLPREYTAPGSAAKPSLLPDEIPSAVRPSVAPGPSGGVKERRTPRLASAASELDMRIRYRKARNVAEAGEKVRAAWDESRASTTDHGKRQALKRYQDLLFTKMLSIDKGIAPLVDQRRKAERALLEQTRIAPTVLSE
jgi:hypothetical protein